jgi:hypothetical protein
MMADFNCMVGLNFELLKTELNAIYSKGDKGYKVLLAPTDVEAQNSVSLGEMVEEFKGALGMDDANQKSISGALESVNSGSEGGNASGAGKSKFNVNNLKFQLNAAFLYINSEGDAKTTEYALAISVDAQDALPSFGFFKINSLSLAVWNTGRAGVLSRMNLGSIEKLLPA